MPDHASEIGRDERSHEEKLQDRGISPTEHPAMDENLGNPDYRVAQHGTQGQTEDDSDDNSDGQHTYSEGKPQPPARKVARMAAEVEAEAEAKDRPQNQLEEEQEHHLSEQSQRDRDETTAPNAGKGQHDRNSDRRQVEAETINQQRRLATTSTAHKEGTRKHVPFSMPAPV